MNKKKIIIIALSIFILLIGGSLTINQIRFNNSKLPGKNTSAQHELPNRIYPSPTPPEKNNEELLNQDPPGLRRSQEILVKVLGIPEKDIRSMSQEEMNNLFIENADILGVQVWGSTYKENGEWEIELIAGSEIFDPIATKTNIQNQP